MVDDELRRKVQWLVDREQIRDAVRDTYFFLLDTKDRTAARFDELAERCFTKDVVFEYPDGMRIQGREEMTKFRARLKENYYARVRDFGHCYIEVDGDRARAWLTMSHATWNTEDSDPEKPDKVSYGACHYNELRRQDDGWRVYFRRWTPIRPQKKPPSFVISAAAQAKATR